MEDDRFIFAIGQQKKDINGKDFSTLVPVAQLDGTPITDARHDFPNRGRVWWMVKGDSRIVYAPPGCLVISGIENAPQQSSDPQKDKLQALQPSLPRHTDLLEILTPASPPSEPSALLDDFRMACSHEPTRFVLVRLGDDLYGPFKLDLLGAETDRELQPSVGFSKPAVPHRVYRFADPAKVRPPGYLKHSVFVWPGDRILSEGEGHQMKYEAVTGALYEEMRATAEEVELVSKKEVMQRVTATLATKRTKQEFVAKFSPLLDTPGLSPGTYERAREILAQQDAAASGVSSFFDAVVDDPDFQPRIESAIKEKVDRRVAELAAQIDARAQEEVSDLNRRKAELAAQIREEEETFQRQRAKRFELVELELSERRQAVDAELEGKRLQLAHFEEAITGSFEAAITRLESGRSSVLSDFLALEPLMRRLFGAVGAQGASAVQTPASTARPVKLWTPPMRKAPIVHIGEDDFFDRFVSHVEASGFHFERDDLIAFQIAAKQGAPTILAGVSGTGKSSLPTLYAEALAGDEDSPNCLNIDVNPSWTSPADILGYVDALEHRFVPAASGMVGTLIAAKEERQLFRDAAALYVLCLDEMNLAQPEYYLSDVIQAVSRAPGQQTLSLFDRMAVAQDDPYRDFARVELGPNLIIFGTVNHDETTKPLSLRLLDRCNVIEFRTPRSLPSLRGLAATGQRKATGPMVTMVDLQRWRRDGEVPSSRAVAILDEIQPELRLLGCAITPRRQSAILRGVASAGQLCGIDKSVDIQLVQRVVPQIRGLYRSGAMETLGRLSDLIAAKCEAPLTLAAIEHLRREEQDRYDGFALSEE